jgi:hypothetical protein
LTLVEVAALATVAGGIVMFVFLWVENAQGRSNRNNCLGYLRQVGLAMKAYAFDDVKHLFATMSPRPANSNELFYEMLVRRDYLRDEERSVVQKTWR